MGKKNIKEKKDIKEDKSRENYDELYIPPEVFFRQKCLVCKGGQVTDCTDFGCPLWLYVENARATISDFHNRNLIFLKICEKIYRDKK